MSLPVIIAIAVGVLVAIALVFAGRTGPRVTHIETRRVDGEDGE